LRLGLWPHESLYPSAYRAILPDARTLIEMKKLLILAVLVLPLTSRAAPVTADAYRSKGRAPDPTLKTLG
jgi:hypothetical protein